MGVKGLNLLSRSCYPGLIPNSQNYFTRKNVADRRENSERENSDFGSLRVKEDLTTFWKKRSHHNILSHCIYVLGISPIGNSFWNIFFLGRNLRLIVHETDDFCFCGKFVFYTNQNIVMLFSSTFICGVTSSHML